MGCGLSGAVWFKRRSATDEPGFVRGIGAVKKATLLLFTLAVLSGCDVEDHYHAEHPQCHDLAPGRRLTRGELHDLEHALERRLRVDFNDDLSFENPIGPGRCLGEWRHGEWEIDCENDDVVVNCISP